MRSPLAEAGITKADVRVLARALGLADPDRPSSACLASRIPFGDPSRRRGFDGSRLPSWRFARSAFRQVRVRDFGTWARVEVEREEMDADGDLHRSFIDARLRELGFSRPGRRSHTPGPGQGTAPMPRPDAARRWRRRRAPDRRGAGSTNSCATSPPAGSPSTRPHRSLERPSFTDLGFARVDHHRRLGRASLEFVYAPGKSRAAAARRSSMPSSRTTRGAWS